MSIDFKYIFLMLENSPLFIAYNNFSYWACEIEWGFCCIHSRIFNEMPRYSLSWWGSWLIFMAKSKGAINNVENIIIIVSLQSINWIQPQWFLVFSYENINCLTIRDRCEHANRKNETLTNIEGYPQVLFERMNWSWKWKWNPSTSPHRFTMNYIINFWSSFVISESKWR